MVSDIEDVAKEVVIIKPGEIIVQDTVENLISNLGKTQENIYNLEDVFVDYTKERKGVVKLYIGDTTQ